MIGRISKRGSGVLPGPRARMRGARSLLIAVALAACSAETPSPGPTSGVAQLAMLEGALAPVDAPRREDPELHRAAREGRWHDVLAQVDRSRALVRELGEHDRTLLMYAAASADPASLRRLLVLGADPGARDRSGNTALFFLPTRDEPAGVLALLAAGAEPDVQNRAGTTPLLSAALLGHLEILRALLAAGANPELGPEGRTPLREALLAGQVEAAELLRTHGASLDDEQRALVLERAARRGDASSLGLALSLGPSERSCTDALLTAREAALQAGSAPALLRLIEERSPCRQACDLAGLDPLQRAAELGQVDVVDALLMRAHPVDTRGCDPYERTPLLWAAQMGSDRIARQLLDAGADPNARTSGGATALMHAARRGDEALVALLVERGADVGATNKDGHSALAFAVVYGRENVVDQLLEQRPPTDSLVHVDSMGRMTPLALAVGRGHTHIARALVEAGASVEARSDVAGVGRVTPLELARRRDDPELTALLAEAASRRER